jgi:hypothetical protein
MELGLKRNAALHVADSLSQAPCPMHDVSACTCMCASLPRTQNVSRGKQSTNVTFRAQLLVHWVQQGDTTRAHVSAEEGHMRQCRGANLRTQHAYPQSPLQPSHRSTTFVQALQTLYGPCSTNSTAVI